MRVTTRRLQASLDLLQNRPDELGICKLKRRLRRWRRRLSLVRNYDVFLSMVDAESQQPARRRDYELIRAELLKRRTRRACKVDTYLQRVRISSIGDKLGIPRPSPAVVTDPDTASAQASAPEPIVECAEAEPAVHDAGSDRRQAPLLIDERKVARRAADRLDQRLAEFQALAAEAHPTTDPLEIHRLRIAAKRLRYLMEAVCRLGYGDATRAIGWLRLLQDNLGDWHDIDAFEEEIIDIVSRRKFMKSNLPETADILHATALLSKKKERLIRKIFPVKPPAVLRGTSNRLARSLRRTANSAPAAKTA
jgi:CHAD domain-containing protein